MLKEGGNPVDYWWNKPTAQWIIRGQSGRFTTARNFGVAGFTKLVRLLSALLGQFATTTVEMFSSVGWRLSTGFGIYYDYYYIFDLNKIGAVK